ncbi:hypothetical protein Mal48_40190 [Thalassoglobus polymorphus]|uniref:Uncharacterized protein n=1 Tax=Thalassoglobus polymorphus TaxID=2527994 RepID=A0A517QT75_9PLAN|nr:hypothetical protein Mal48_40190 [Thalassoglobus polymorphus]
MGRRLVTVSLLEQFALEQFSLPCAYEGAVFEPLSQVQLSHHD